jgi:hypothetical protein
VGKLLKFKWAVLLKCLRNASEKQNAREAVLSEHPKTTVFWVVAPCSLVEVYRRFRGACCLHHHGATIQKTAIFVLTAVRISNPTVRTSVSKYRSDRRTPSRRLRASSFPCSVRELPSGGRQWIHGLQRNNTFETLCYISQRISSERSLHSPRNHADEFQLALCTTFNLFEIKKAVIVTSWCKLLKVVENSRKLGTYSAQSHPVKSCVCVPVNDSPKWVNVNGLILV